MSRYRDALPQLSGDPFLTDGGLETTLVFHKGYDLPYFASLVLLETDEGRRELSDYCRAYADLAVQAGAGFVIETPTWRANPDWMQKLGYDDAGMRDINRRGVELTAALRPEYEERGTPFVVSGNIGPRGDGYVVGKTMTADEASAYHDAQIATFAETEADLVTALTMTYADEATGIVRAAKRHGMPVVISFTTETDGRLPSGQRLKDAIEQVDAASDGGPDYYMINCAHTDHFSDSLQAGAAWTQRIRGVRANASRCSHAELDEAETLDDGDPTEFGSLYRELKSRFPQLNVFGGCCGTDERHIAAINLAA